MFALPSLSSLSLSNWLPTSLTSRLTHYAIKRALSFCFELPADWQASNLDQGALVLNELKLDVAAITQRLPSDAPLVLKSGKVRQLALSLSQSVSWASSTLSIRIDGLDVELALKSASGDPTSLSESLFEDFNQEDLARSVAQTILLDQERVAEDAEEQRQLKESLEDAAHGLPGAFFASPDAPEDDGYHEEEQTTLLASVIARLVAGVSIELTDTTVVAALPVPQAVEHHNNAPPSLRLRFDAASLSTEAQDRSRQASLEGLVLTLRLASPSTAQQQGQQTTATPPSDSTTASDAESSTTEESLDDMSMSMAVADLRESQVLTRRPDSFPSGERGGTSNSASTSTSRLQPSMPNIEESLYLSAEEEESSDSEVGEADEQPSFAQTEPSADESEPSQSPQYTASVEASSEQDELKETSSLHDWQPFFSQGSERIAVHVAFPASGFAPSSIDIHIGHPVALLSAQQVDALLLLKTMSPPPPSAVPAPPTSPSAKTPPRRMNTSVSARGASVIVWTDPEPQHQSLSDLFWTRPWSNPPSSVTGFMSMKLTNLSLSTSEHNLSVRDFEISEFAPQIGFLPVLNVDDSLGQEYTEQAHHHEDSQAGAPFPAVAAQDWVHLVASASSSGPHQSARALPRAWKLPPRAHFRKTSVNESGSPARLVPALRMALVNGSVHLSTRPLHVRLDLGLVGRLGRLLSFFSPSSSSPEEPTLSKKRVSKSVNHSSSRLQCSVPVARVELRGPATSRGSINTRSGVVTLDIHDFRAQLASAKSEVAFKRANGFFLSAGSSEARMWLQLSSADEQPQLSFSQKSCDAAKLLAFVLPVVTCDVDKRVLDGLSLFADDVSQLQLSLSQAAQEESEPMVGSRYFGKQSIYKPAWDDATRRENSSSSAEEGEEGPSESSVVDSRRPILELAGSIHQASVRAHLEKRDAFEQGERTVNLVASEMDLFVTSKNNDKSEIQLVLVCKVLEFSELDALPYVKPLEQTVQNEEPLLRLKLVSSTDSATSVKENKIDVSIKAVTFVYHPDLRWMQDLQAFAKPPKGVFEAAVPPEKTRIKLRLNHISLCVLPRDQKTERALVTLQELQYSANLIPEHPSSLARGSLTGFKIWVVDVEKTPSDQEAFRHPAFEDIWKSRGFVDLLTLSHCSLTMKLGNGNILPDCDLHLFEPTITLAPCADSMVTLAHTLSSAAAIQLNQRPKMTDSMATDEAEPPKNPVLSVLEHLDEAVFHRAISLESPIDIVSDDVPGDPTFLGEEALSGSFATITKAAPRQDELEHRVEVSDEHQHVLMLDAAAFDYHDNYLTPERYADELAARADACVTRIKVTGASLSLQLFDGFDWEGSAQAVRAEARRTRRRLQKLRQYVANGQTGVDPEGLDQEAPSGAPADHDHEEADLLAHLKSEAAGNQAEGPEQAAILEALDSEIQAASDSEDWETLPAPSSPHPESPRPTAQSLPTTRTAPTHRRPPECAMDVRLQGLDFDFSTFPASKSTACLLNLSAQTLNIVDNIKTSTWKMFLTELRVQDGGFARPTNAPMLRFQFAQDRSATDRKVVESRLKARTSPLRLHVDQDAVDFLKKFFSYKAPEAAEARAATEQTGTGSHADDSFIKSAELFPIKIKLDYKPKRVDYRALREGRTAELMNFFHFEGSEMTLRHITLSGVTGWDRFGSMLQDIWTPDVKANQLADVVSGIAPIRSVVNVGSGLADLVLLPMEQYRRDKRVTTRGLQKGLASFSKTTALESLRLGARLATGTQVILEKAEAVLGGGRLSRNITAEALTTDEPSSATPTVSATFDPDGLPVPLSRYASQPETLQEGMREAYSTMRSNLRTTAQTILAVPMEVHERSGQEGSARAVLRAVPIAVLHPAIGATDAMSKALFGLSNQLDPTYELRQDKYK